MDPGVIEALRQAGIDATFKESMPVIALRVDEKGGALPHCDEFIAFDGKRTALVTLKKTSALFVGDHKPPDFSADPPPEYIWFFLSIERAAADYCACTDETVRDEEFEQIYGDLRRRPDSRSNDPLLSHVQAAIRFYMSLRDVSQAEYEAVLRRLARSARTFATGCTSMNYLQSALLPLLDVREHHS